MNLLFFFKKILHCLLSRFGSTKKTWMRLFSKFIKFEVENGAFFNNLKLLEIIISKEFWQEKNFILNLP